MTPKKRQNSYFAVRDRRCHTATEYPNGRPPIGWWAAAVKSSLASSEEKVPNNYLHCTIGDCSLLPLIRKIGYYPKDREPFFDLYSKILSYLLD